YEVGDRIEAHDLVEYESFRVELEQLREAHGSVPPPLLLKRIDALRNRVPLLGRRIPQGFDLERDWPAVPASDREDLARSPQYFADMDTKLDRLIVYDTSGMTGHALVAPSHPLTQAKVNALMEFVLKRHGVELDTGPGKAICVNINAQAETVVFATLFGVWNQAGFAKVNLHPKFWRDRDAARNWFTEFQPQFLTGDPVAFAEMIAWELPVRPRALVSTALALNPELAELLEEAYGCPVIDWYSTAETGPLAYSCPHGHGLHLISPDLFIEVLDADGKALPEGQRGEIAVTGGRNPYIFLLRYRTGDTASIDRTPCSCGDSLPRLLGLEGRRPLLFRGHDGGPVNSVDVSRVLRHHPILQHQVRQQADSSILARLRPIPGAPLDSRAVERSLRTLFGDLAMDIYIDPNLGADSQSGKVLPFISELAPEPGNPALAAALGASPPSSS
ncbi:MAG: hypothetical protein D6E12_16445, partial [Desulfovibrio sp.]